MTGLQNKTIKSLLATSIIAATLTLSGCGGDQQTGQDASMHIKRGETYLNQGQFKAAMIEARNALQKAPTKIDSHLLMTDILMEMGQYKPALDQMDAVDGNTSTDYLLTKAEAYNHLQKYRSAENLLAEHQSTLRQADKKRYLQLMGKAKLGQKDIEAAKAAYSELKLLDPESANTLTLLAQLALVEGNIEDATSLLEKALTADDSYTEALLLKANILFHQQDLTGTEDTLTQALTGLNNTDIITPTRSNILRKLAQVLNLQGRSSEALIYTRILAEALPGADIAKAKLQEAIESYKAKDLPTAKEQLTDLLNEYPDFEQASQLLAIINFLQGDLEAANNYFSQNLDPEIASDKLNEVAALTSLRLKQPQQVVTMLGDEAATTDNPNILTLYGLAALSTNTPTKGEQALLKSIEIDPQPQPRLALAAFYNRQTPPQPQKALKQLELAFTADTDKPFIQQALINQYLLLGEKDKAGDTLNQILKKHPELASSHYLAGQYYLSQQQPDKAQSAFLQAINQQPDHIGSLIGLAQIQQARKDLNEAAKSYKKIIGLAPENPTAYRGLLAVSKLQGQTQKTIEEYFVELAKSSNDTTPLLVMAEDHLKNEQPDNAKNMADMARNLAPNEPRITGLLALIEYQVATTALRASDFKTAREASLRGLQYTPNSELLLILLTEIEISSDNLTEARKLIEQLAPLNQSAALYLQGELAGSGSSPDLEKALDYYNQSWQLRPSDPLGQKIHALYSQLQLNQEKNRFIDQWQAAFPNSFAATMAKSNWLIGQGDFTQATKHLEQLVLAYPKQAIAWNNLAWSYLQNGDSQAEASAQQAYQLAPENPAILDTYGWVLFKNGKTEEAKVMLEKAVSLAPEIQEIQEHLATVMQEG